MKREAYKSLLDWKRGSVRKPLIVQGARQVGKTWLIKAFAAAEYESHVYVNFEVSKNLQNIFSSGYNVKRILSAIEIETGVKVEPGRTLLILDEIQAAPGGLGALKYFEESDENYDLIAAGSLLGMALHNNHSFPVGKIQFLDLYPLNFFEFLEAMSEQHLMQVIIDREWTLVAGFRERLIERLRQYYFIGGMPEVVASFVELNDYDRVRALQNDILRAYELDFSKYAPTEIVPRIRMLWNSIPAQLSKENKKFIYGIIREGARAKEYEAALLWLKNCGLIHQVHAVSKPGIPLKSYEEARNFKIYICDIGLLNAMADLDISILLQGNRSFTEFKGGLAEQFVLQQLIGKFTSIYYWSPANKRAEVDFLIQHKGKILPVEVKAEENLRSRSLRVYFDTYAPKTAYRASLSDYREESWLINLPLYAVSILSELAGGEMKVE